jgi:hypothetical protein
VYTSSKTRCSKNEQLGANSFELELTRDDNEDDRACEKR